MGIAEMIPAELGFPGGQNLVLFHPPFPQRYVLTVPLVEVQVEPPEDQRSSFRLQSETFSYDHSGHVDRKGKKGLLIDSYF